MKTEGPALETLTRRIAETPADFLAEAQIGRTGEVHVPAVVYDLLRMHGKAPALPDLAAFAGRDAKHDRKRLSITLVMCWLLADESLRHSRVDAAVILEFLRDDAQQLAAYCTAQKLIQDADRREELARLCLARLEMRPAGETLAQAQDRLTSLSSVERARVLKASRESEERARAIREALVRKAAEESADKYTRE